MFDHISTYATDFVITRDFYLAALAPLQLTLVAEFESVNPDSGETERVCAFGKPGRGALWVIESVKRYTPRHMAFSASSQQQVDLFYSTAIAAGALDNGQPGLRPEYHADYYAAFVIDPDGNDIEAVYHGAAEV